MLRLQVDVSCTFMFIQVSSTAWKTEVYWPSWWLIFQISTCDLYSKLLGRAYGLWICLQSVLSRTLKCLACRNHCSSVNFPFWIGLSLSIVLLQAVKEVSRHCCCYYRQANLCNVTSIYFPWVRLTTINATSISNKVKVNMTVVSLHLEMLEIIVLLFNVIKVDLGGFMFIPSSWVHFVMRFRVCCKRLLITLPSSYHCDLESTIAHPINSSIN